MEYSNLDWGSVPAWLGAGSLILAYLVFIRDRGNSDREQVNLVGAWASVEYERRAPWDTPRTEAGEITAYVRNASQLPVRVKQIAYRVESAWCVPDRMQSEYPEGPGAWSRELGTQSQLTYHNDFRVAPQETRELAFSVNVAHMAPEGATQLDVVDGITAHVEWLLIVDNAGRRWEVHPESGGRARRVGRMWRAKENMPQGW